MSGFELLPFLASAGTGAAGAAAPAAAAAAAPAAAAGTAAATGAGIGAGAGALGGGLTGLTTAQGLAVPLAGGSVGSSLATMPFVPTSMAPAVMQGANALAGAASNKPLMAGLKMMSAGQKQQGGNPAPPPMKHPAPMAAPQGSQIAQQRMQAGQRASGPFQRRAMYRKDPREEMLRGLLY